MAQLLRHQFLKLLLRLSQTSITLDDLPSLTLELAQRQLPKTASVILKTCTASLT